jgi:hypothetical protein
MKNEIMYPKNQFWFSNLVGFKFLFDESLAVPVLVLNMLFCISVLFCALV